MLISRHVQSLLEAFLKSLNSASVLTQTLVRHHDVGVAFAHLLLLLAPVLNADRLVGFHHVCDLQLGVHLSGEEERASNNERGISDVCERRCVKWSFSGIL